MCRVARGMLHTLHLPQPSVGRTAPPRVAIPYHPRVWVPCRLAELDQQKQNLETLEFLACHV